MGTRVLALVFVALAAAVLVCEVQQLNSLAAIDVEDAQRGPTVLDGIATNAMEATAGGATGATVVVMVWVNGECRVYRKTLDWGVPEEGYPEAGLPSAPPRVSADGALVPYVGPGPDVPVTPVSSAGRWPVAGRPSQ